MIFGLLVTFTTCAAAWFLTGHPQRRGIGFVFAFADTVLWLFAGITAGKIAIVVVAAFCAVCFARPVLRHLARLVWRQHA
ncbi:MAG TPA: hypothetical protein VGL08_19650 [Paraburkholderia sp.]|jgi:hypothetical protein